MMMSKVVEERLLKPALSQRFPLPLPPKQSALHMNPNAALDLEPNETDDHFLLNPVVC